MTAEIPALAALCLKTEAQFLALQQAALKSLFPNASPPFSVHRSESSSALTVITDLSWLWKLNHTVCFGIQLEPYPRSADFGGELGWIERVYNNAGATPHFNMCELADPAALKVLQERGYVNTGHLETFCKAIRPSPTDYKMIGDVVSREIIMEETNNAEIFIEKSVEGFLSGGRPPELLRVLARTAVARQDMKLFFARIEGEIVGCAGLALMDIKNGVKSAYLCIDSTLPEFRGRGVHVALLKHRIRVAEQSGCQLVVCAARQGSGSARNIQRAGLTTIYKSEAYTRSNPAL